LTEHPEYFVLSETEKAGNFSPRDFRGRSLDCVWQDPYFPAWTDVAQLEYRNLATRTAMTELLQSVAARCDGVRCDMSMLLLNEIFPKTWAHFPVNYQMHASEFWSDAIQAVKRDVPEFLFSCGSVLGTGRKTSVARL